MRGITVLAALACLMGSNCEFGDGSGTLEAGQPCSVTGYVTPSSAALTITAFEVDGLPILPGWDAAADYNGEPAVCWHADSGTARLIFTVDNERFGTIVVGGVEPGSFDPNIEEGLLRVDLLGDLPVSYEAGDWQTGIVTVDSADPLEVDVAVDAVKNGTGQTMSISFSTVVTP